MGFVIPLKSHILLVSSINSFNKTLKIYDVWWFTERKPNYGCQVFVHSEQEKLLMKQVRKDEKKMNKLMTKEEELELEEETFDPIELRRKRF